MIKRSRGLVTGLFFLFGIYFLNLPFKFVNLPEFISSMNSWISLVGGVLLLYGGICYWKSSKFVY